MTHDELHALPESATIVTREQVIDGRKVRVPVAVNAFALFEKEGDGTFADNEGVLWRTGWAQGKRWRCRVRGAF